jgi:hypothetical protein
MYSTAPTPTSTSDNAGMLPTPTQSYQGYDEEAYGFIPMQLVTTIESSRNWRDRAAAVQEIENIVVSKGRNFTIVLPYIREFT